MVLGSLLEHELDVNIKPSSHSILTFISLPFFSFFFFFFILFFTFIRRAFKTILANFRDFFIVFVQLNEKKPHILFLTFEMPVSSEQFFDGKPG